MINVKGCWCRGFMTFTLDAFLLYKIWKLIKIKIRCFLLIENEIGFEENKSIILDALNVFWIRKVFEKFKYILVLWKPLPEFIQFLWIILGLCARCVTKDRPTTSLDKIMQGTKSLKIQAINFLVCTILIFIF